MKSVFFDTSPLIYYLDGSEPFASKVERFLLSAMNSGKELRTSIITDTEYFVHPYKEHNYVKIAVYRDFLRATHFVKNSIDEETADKASQIRAKYKSIKTADSLQLASAICSECDVFLTNDKQLRQVEEIRVLLVDDL